MKHIISKNIPQNAVGIWWIGQSGFVFKTSEGKIIFIDPYLSNYASGGRQRERMAEIPFLPNEVFADAVFCTHNHADHTDPVTIKGIADTSTVKFIGPTSCCRQFEKLGINSERVIEINRGERREISGITMNAVFAKHTEDSIGYILNINSMVIYITGDTEYDDKLKKVSAFKPDILIICINGKLGNMNIEEATLLTKEINPKIVIPMHYGMFKQNTADPQDFLAALKKREVKAKAVIIDINNCFLYQKEN